MSQPDLWHETVFSALYIKLSFAHNVSVKFVPSDLRIHIGHRRSQKNSLALSSRLWWRGGGEGRGG